MSDKPKNEQKVGPPELEWLAQSLGFNSTGLQPAFVDLLNNISTMRYLTFEPGKIIVSEGERGRDLYIIHEGAVKVEVQGDDGKTRDIAELSPGDFFGEIGFLVENIRTATVTSIETLKVFRLNAPELRASLETQEKVLKRVEETARERIMQLSEMLSAP